MVTCEAEFESLKYILDAKRPPLKDVVHFEKTYGLPRFLSFAPRKKRTQHKMNAFQCVY